MCSCVQNRFVCVGRNMWILLLSMFVLVNKCECVCVINSLVSCGSVVDLFKFGTADWTNLLLQNDGNEIVSSASFRNTRNLEDLHIRGNFSLERNAFLNLTRLRHLKVQENKLTVLPAPVFSKLNLNSLDLQSNQIEDIEFGAFEFSSIKDINLSKNEMLEIKTTNFFLDDLKKLDLSHNKLEILGWNCFPLTLLHLDLSHNNLRGVNLGAFERPSNLQTLILSNNRLETVVTAPFLKSLQTLDLSFNNISYLTEDSLSSPLTNLYLNDNFIKHLPSNGFGQATKISTLHLHNNFLSSLSGVFQDKIGSLVKITLAGNPWLCSCLDETTKQLNSFRVQFERCDYNYFFAGNNPICYVGSDVCDERGTVPGNRQEWLRFRPNNKCKYH